MEQRIKTSIYWLLGAIAAIIVPYKFAIFISLKLGDKIDNQPAFLLWIIGVMALAITIAAVCLASYGFYRWMHWLLNGDENKNQGSDSNY